jgi:hypothetical protein
LCFICACVGGRTCCSHAAGHHRDAIHRAQATNERGKRAVVCTEGLPVGDTCAPPTTHDTHIKYTACVNTEDLLPYSPTSRRRARSLVGMRPFDKPCTRRRISVIWACHKVRHLCARF